jgi:hypothetical protein
MINIELPADGTAALAKILATHKKGCRIHVTVDR